MTGTHHDGHAHGTPSGEADRRWLSAALALIVAFMAAEVAAGLASGSLALLSDAAHMLTDAGSIILALVAMRLAQSTVSKHLACLRDCGLVTSEPSGRASVFRLAQPALAEVLAAAETVLAATSNAVALCPVWGTGCCGDER